MSHYDGSDNALDIQALGEALWRGKTWIVSLAIVFAATALLVSFCVTPRWSSTAVTDKTSIERLGQYYVNQQFINHLDAKAGNLQAPMPSLPESAYQEFVKQLSAWDTRREFWLASAYYQQQRTGDAGKDGLLLDKLTGDIQFQPSDVAKNSADSIRLSAQSAQQANLLLRDYIAFANQRAVNYLNQALLGAWHACTVQLSAQLVRQESAVSAQFTRQIKRIRQALQVASENQIEQPKTIALTSQMADEEIFLLGRPLLQAQLEMLESSGPDYDVEYHTNKALMATLSAGPPQPENFQVYRYLRTPEIPVIRDSPRRMVWVLIWGTTGAFIGAGVALYRRARVVATQSLLSKVRGNA